MKHLQGKLDLRKIPSAVGGDIAKRHGIILAKSIPAKKYNIKTGEPVTDALKKCPSLVLVPPNYELYERSSKAFIKILRDYSDIVEQYSIDEAYVDMTGTRLLFGSPVIAAGIIKDRIERELGFTVNIGISSNKILAKMASDFEKPNKVHTLFPEEIKYKMWHLAVGDLFFVGQATLKVLDKLGIYTIGELANTDLGILRGHLKSHGEVIWRFANGIDHSIVIPEPEPNKGYGNSTTIEFDVHDAGTAKLVLLALAETVGSRLRRDAVKAEVVAVGIKSSDFSYVSHQCVLPAATNITNEIHQTAGRLFDECWDGLPVRHLGIHTSRIRGSSGRQISLFDTVNYEKLEKLDESIDSIRKRYGPDAVKRAAFAESKQLDHMSGGISREKRTVDYKNEKVD